ncbi:MAG: tetratricopeptide repeat protein [Xanthomonadales bacterium]|nr:tetratricopeptide repeat protein [Xanthomonadales bacterium]
MTSLFQELRRRNVFRVSTAYVITAWLLAQVADLALESFEAPAWVMKAILLVLVMGLPVATLLAWAFEITPEGIRRDSDVGQVGVRGGGRLNQIIIGLLVVALGYFIWESRFKGGTEQVGPASVVEKSIAVLPFATFSGNETDQYLSDGLAETLLNRLAQIGELQVAARTSAFKFKGTNEDIRIIGQQLGVATVLEGSIQRSGQRIRITAQLINVDDGFHLYSETFERKLNDLFAVQDEIAKAVVDTLQVTLLGSAAAATTDVDAFETLAGLRGRLRTSDAEGMEALIGSLQQLVERYPGYADAYATLAEANTTLGDGAGEIPEELLARAIAAGRKAVTLEPDNPAGHVALAGALVARGLYNEADPVIGRALELQPGNVDAMVMQGDLLADSRQYQQALDVTSGAVLRDPLNPFTRIKLSRRYQELGRTSESVAAIDLGLELEPGDLTLLLEKARVLYEKGRLAEGWQTLERLRQLDPGSVLAAQHRFYFQFNAFRFDAALKYLEQAEALSRDRLADERALYCFARGDEACWHAATTRMLATRQRFFVQMWQARMLRSSGLLDEAIQSLLPVVAYFDRTGDWYGNLLTRVNLGTLYIENGDLEQGNAILQPVMDGARRAIDNGYENWGLYLELAAAYAALGDDAQAISMLREARARGWAHVDVLFNHYAMDRVWELDEFQPLLVDIQTTAGEQMAGID